MRITSFAFVPPNYEEMNLNFVLQSVLGKMNEIAKHKAAIEDADTESKVLLVHVLDGRVTHRWYHTLEPTVRGCALTVYIDSECVSIYRIYNLVDKARLYMKLAYI